MDTVTELILHINPSAFASYYQDCESNPTKFGIFLGIEENGRGRALFNGPLIYGTAEEAQAKAEELLKDIRCEA